MFVQWQEVANIALPLFQRNPPKSYAEQPDDAVHASAALLFQGISSPSKKVNIESRYRSKRFLYFERISCCSERTSMVSR